MTVMDQAPPQQAIAKRGYNPLAPIGSPGALKGLLEAQKDSLAAMLPRHITPERLFKTMLVAANRTPDLLQCTQASLLETINRAAELGLDLSGTLGEAYPVPFNNRVKTDRGGEQWVKQCQLIIGYRGFAKLARQSGEIKRIEADVVCERDAFDMRKGSDARCTFVPFLKGDRGKPVGAFAYVLFKDGGEQFDFMPYDDIEKVRRRSKAGADKNGNAIGAWKTDWPEMAKKTVFRRVAKWLPLSTEKFVRAMEHEADDHLSDVLEATTAGTEATGQTRGASALAARLTSRPVSEGQTFEPAPEAFAAAAGDEADHVCLGEPPTLTAPQDDAGDQAGGGGGGDEPDVSGADAEPPPPSDDAPGTAPDLSTVDALKDAIDELAQRLGRTNSDAGTAKLNIPKAAASRVSARREYYAAVAREWAKG